MPQATVTTETTHVMLESAPPDGFVDLRRMSYGKWLQRQEMAMKMSIGGLSGKNASADIAMANKDVTVFEFANCVVDHNLTDANGDKLNFASAVSLELLDPKVGNEIATHIMEMHEFDSGNSSSGSSSA